MARVKRRAPDTGDLQAAIPIDNRQPSFTTHSPAFTLVELLMVIAIIALLIALTLPTIKKAKEVARSVKCGTQMRSIAVAFNLFAEEHHNILPGNASLWSGAEWWQKSWIGDEFYRPDGFLGHDGTLLEYINGPGAAREIYRCPSLASGAPGSSTGSNGRYDYVSPGVFSGANRDLMPPRSQVPIPRQTVTTPLIVEEDPAAFGNDKPFPEPAYTNIDRMGQWHVASTINYAAVDTSIHQISFRRSSYGEDLGIIYWHADGPSGQEWNLGGYDPLPEYGMWNGM